MGLWGSHTGRLSLGTPTRGAQRVSNRGCSHTATSRTEGQGPKEWEWMPSQQRRTGHLPREGMLTQGTDTHLGGTFTQKGTLTGRGYSPGRDTRQGGPLTREGHSPGRDTHQEAGLVAPWHMGSSWIRDQTCPLHWQVDSFPAEPQGTRDRKSVV